jgi:hypothetical protein
MVETHKIPSAIIRWTLILGFVWFLWYALVPAHPITKERAYDLIAREVPLETHRSEIENWFKSKGWGNRYGYSVKDEFTVSGWYKGRPEDMKGYVACFIEDNSRTIYGSGDLVLVFYLDKDDKLIQVYCHQYTNAL